MTASVQSSACHMSLMSVYQHGADQLGRARGGRGQLKQGITGKRADVHGVSLNCSFPESSSAEKIYSAVLLIYPGAFKHGRFGIELLQGTSGIPG